MVDALAPILAGAEKLAGKLGSDGPALVKVVTQKLQASIGSWEFVTGFRDVGLPEDEVTTLMGIVGYYISRGKGGTAARAGEDAVVAAQALGNKGLEASALLVLADALLLDSRVDEALLAGSRAYNMSTDNAVKGSACKQVARASLAKKDAKAAATKAAEGVALAKNSGDKAVQAATLHTLAEAQVLQKDAEMALKAGQEAAALFKDLDDKSGQASVLQAMASAYALKDDKETGLKCAREALVLAREASDRGAEVLARATCASLRPKSERKVPPKGPEQPPLGLTKAIVNCMPGISAPGGVQAEGVVRTVRLCGSAEHKTLSGLVCIITGASRGIGKGISLCLAEAGAVVYVTGRSSPGKVTDILLMGTVDETAASFTKLGGVGVATHVDHAQDTQNKALVSLIANNHGRLDCLVNNAFYIPKPDLIFFSTPLWMQPMRFLNEQTAVGGFNHAAQTLLFAPCLRRGKGVVVNVSSWGSQINIPIFPVSYLCNKAAFDRTIAALSEKLHPYGIYVSTLWPGSVKSERSVVGAKRSGAKLIDLETTRFSGYAVVGIAKMTPTELKRFACANRVVASADIQKFEVDGYMHQGDLHTFTAGGRTPFI
mmetsp:Transcript_77630/g.180060  ORF Transcript_77630/g.180060 Transcript_77630/m.180060 type:complete len:603 (-) Transcript_77630:124-1932(-)